MIAHAARSTAAAIAKRIVESSRGGTAFTPSFAAIHWPPRVSASVTYTPTTIGAWPTRGMLEAAGSAE